VLFVDGSSKQVGAIVYAMGYCIAFPVMATAQPSSKNDYLTLRLTVFRPVYNNLFVVALIQPDSGQVA
jgi:hypothetical protein